MNNEHLVIGPGKIIKQLLRLIFNRYAGAVLVLDCDNKHAYTLFSKKPRRVSVEELAAGINHAIQSAQMFDLIDIRKQGYNGGDGNNRQRPDSSPPDPRNEG